MIIFHFRKTRYFELITNYLVLFSNSIGIALTLTSSETLDLDVTDILSNKFQLLYVKVFLIFPSQKILSMPALHILSTMVTLCHV